MSKEQAKKVLTDLADSLRMNKQERDTVYTAISVLAAETRLEKETINE